MRERQKWDRWKGTESNKFGKISRILFASRIQFPTAPRIEAKIP